MQTGAAKMMMQKASPLNIWDIIESKSLVAHFQQIVSVSRKMVIGLEGLIRGVDACTGELIPPKRLFEAAAEENAALEFDRACRETILGAFKEIYTHNQEKLLFLNLDASILQNSVGSDYLLEQVRRHGINPGNIVIEISEKKVEGSAALKKFTDSYKRYGFMVALDDVGSEASNIDRLILVRPDIIKIDISLIRNIQNDFYKQGVYRSLVNMSSKIGALVIAEGTETEAEAIQVLRLGGQMIQGFFFSEVQVYADEKAAFFNHKIELLSKRFNEYMNLQYIEERKTSKRLYAVSSRAAKSLVTQTYAQYDEALREIISKHPDMECAYILDRNGVQVSDTVCSACEAERRESLIFYKARKGTDHSMEKYYYPLISTRVKKHMTQPYISLATGNLCVTVSVAFTNTYNESCILCIDFRAGDAACETELKNQLHDFGKGYGTDIRLSGKMNEAALTDSLTDAFNRRYIEERLIVDAYNATSNERPISIILADIDRFKSINDSCGHLAGDEVLRAFVRISKGFIRKNSDWIARYGGDEFLIVLSSADERAAVTVAEKIRRAIEKTVIRHDEADMCFTASFGVYTAHSKNVTCDQLIRQADRNLYAAKKAGRNKVADSVRS